MIFLNLRKVYDISDRDICPEILEGYGVVPRACHVLHAFWYRHKMVARVGGNYGAVFQGFLGMTQGDPLSPISFNMMVDVEVSQWGWR